MANPANGVAPSPESQIPGAIDASAVGEIMHKYGEERTKRLRSDGLAQYIDLATSDKYRGLWDDPWVEPRTEEASPALRDGSTPKFLIVGGGMGAVLFGIRLVQAGVEPSAIYFIDSAGSFGGTWYWNRYPGLTCDVESSVYLPLLEETGYVPKNRYSQGGEIRDYIHMILKKWNLIDRGTFGVEAKGMTWDDQQKRWDVQLKKDQSEFTVHAQFVLAAPGLLNFPHIPDVPGIDEFKGDVFHTSRWNYQCTGGSQQDPSLSNLTNSKVAIIGTGASTVQVLSHLAKWAKEVHVFQRTPSSIDVRGQRPTDPEKWASEVSNKKGWQRERMRNFTALVTNAQPRPAVDLVNDGWTHIPSYNALLGGPVKISFDQIPSHLATLHALDVPRQERIRGRVDELVKNKETAEVLKPWFPTWCKRPCFSDEYLQAFNNLNVKLVDTAGKGIERITTNGIVVEGKEYPTDVIIFSTGYLSPAHGSPATKAHMSIIGRGGRSLNQKWAEGMSTLHGIMSRDFPNFFWPGPNQASSTGNYTELVEELSKHVAYIITESAKKSPAGEVTIEPSMEGELAWTAEIVSGAAGFAGLSGCTPGYLNSEGEADRAASLEEQMKGARRALWGEGPLPFFDTLEKWRTNGGLEGLEVVC